MPEAAGKAVFLSYASQDAEAARRICETLRGAGMEVWFDADGGLEQGDEWDAKIRRQIKECVLFLPLISANTQARHEGYFRIEWELAAERAMGVASGVPFILPIAIDATREPDALVPDRFRKVQWTRLPAGQMPPDVLARFMKLWSHRTGTLAHAPTTTQIASTVAPATRLANQQRRSAELSEWPLSELAMMQAIGGDSAGALASVAELERLLPDIIAVGQLIFRARLATIYAWAGDKDRALRELTGLLHEPGAHIARFDGGDDYRARINIHELRSCLEFSPLQGDPRFEALLNDPKNNEPLF